MNDRIVEAIEQGRIVKVPEDYARREGLPILRRQVMDGYGQIETGSKSEGEEKVLDLSLRGWENKEWVLYKKNFVAKDLIDNFHWHISRARRARGLSRKQVAEAIGEKEDSLKMIENGVLEKDDFMLVNKVQDYLSINLRKVRIEEPVQPLREKIESMEKQEEEQAEEEKKDNISGDEIELLE